MKKNLIKSAFLALLLCLCSSLFSQNVGINTTGTAPSNNAILDLNSGNSNNMGLLVPNVTLGAALTTFNPPMANVPNAGDKGMLVYNNVATNQPIGFYYWNGTAWVSVSGGGGGVTSVTGTAPVNVTPTTGAVAVSLQGTAGAVCYGTGGGSNFNAAGTAPTTVSYAAPATPLSAQVLVSNGAGAPAWTNAGGATLLVYKGFTTDAEAALAAYTITGATGYWSSDYDALYVASNAVTQIRMPHCVVTNLHVVPNANATSKSTTWQVNNETRGTNLSGTLAAGSAVVSNYPGSLSFSDGDMLDVSTTWQAGSTGALSVVKIEIQYYILP